MAALLQGKGKKNGVIALVVVVAFIPLVVSTGRAMLKNPPLVTENPREKASGNKLPVKKWVLARRPEGIFSEENCKLVEDSIDIDALEEDEVVVKPLYLSVDAFIRTMLDEEAYHGSVPLEGVMPALGMGEVIHSGKKAKHKVGAVVQGMLGAQSATVLKSKEAMGALRLPWTPPTAGLGLLGLTTGVTAWVGCFAVAAPPKRGQTVVVSAAAGAVGSVAAQLLLRRGCRVIGIAGGAQKCAYLTEELGLAGAVDYKAAPGGLDAQLRAQCPDGVDFFFDNVGGGTLDALLPLLNPKARVIICGAVSQYSGNLNKGRVEGPANYLKLAERGASMHGYNVMQHFAKLPLALISLLWHFWRGHLQMRETIVEGLESFPLALKAMFTGGHIGKLLVKCY